MKFGVRKPSIKKSLSTRTSIKRQVIHRSGLKMPRGDCLNKPFGAFYFS
ncbi:hypothetical protein VEGAS_34 [Paenibacillus phage Vegas]|uniref:Uncharacterized protein n=4 Tax=Vegasvirus vegas TaxID=2034999 RepID=A0A0K2CZ41_9CAUD|nr:hypothetical protein VEGAS_34 [Paenibacillus phage Vegas]ALA12682.1 hypothetical protein VEGAS_34 [Paenibacillus phage Vegas]ALA12765.1 hypothetical protein HAYLEY_32 [Paenibacillus phage Hayley]ALA12852.1 hypothetical protein VADIM_34 [Paenibacillus phage Vadim]ALA12938.1 hypothetical protein DIANE_34 [Paenibacillus phage Diane]